MGLYIILKAGRNRFCEMSGSEERPDLRFLQSKVGGYIEFVCCRHLPEGVDMFCDEEGKLKNKEVNPLATKLFGNDGDVIVGDVVLVGRDDDCNSVWLTSEQAKAVWEAVKK